MRPATASRLARLVPALLAMGLVLAACVTTAAPGWTFEPPPTKSAPASASASTAPSAPASNAASSSASASSAVSPSASAAPSASPSGGGGTADQVKITASNTTYDTSAIEAKAGQAFQIVFTNNDSGIPHNVQIKAADGSEAFKGSILTGPGSVTYDVPALAAGSYTFSCVVHPTMTGTLTVK
jgi:plastocyanin